MSATVALQVEGLTVRYGGAIANDNVSLAIERGEIRGLIGPNGAGKSTFIDAVSGRRKAAAGRVQLFGQDISRLNAVERRILGLARSFQRTSIFPLMRVGDQIELAAAKFPSSDAGQIISELGLHPYVDLPAANVGYGDQRRLDIALSLVGNAAVLLLDEPMAGLSIEESIKLADHLRDLARRLNVSVLLVEHDMEVVFRVCDSITVLESGKLLAEGTPAEIRAHPRVRSAYLGSAA